MRGRWAAIDVSALLVVAFAALSGACVSRSAVGQVHTTTQPTGVHAPVGFPSPPTVSRVPPGTHLLVVESHPPSSNSTSRAGRVSLITADGDVVASLDYEAPSVPNIGNAGAILPNDVMATQHAAYAVDSQGVVHRLSADGAGSAVATFPLLKPHGDASPTASGWRSSYDQEEFAFAISPDDRDIIAATYRLPNVVVDPTCPPDRGPGCMQFTPNTVHVEVFTARIGTQPALVHSEDIGYQVNWTSQYPIIAGWDGQGPIGALNRATGAQQGGPWMENRIGGYVTHLDSQGRPGATVGGSDCLAWAELSDQELLCEVGGYQTQPTANTFSLRRPDGTTDWEARPPAAIQFLIYAAVSPDGSHLAVGDDTAAVDMSRDGTIVALPGTFHPSVWLDRETIAGEAGDTSALGDSGQGVALVSIKSPSNMKPLGVPGRVVGTVTAA